jgi:DNA mismatch repair ATPase MutS
LDGITMKNLDLLVNSSTGTEAGTLIQQIDRCVTPFGKRFAHLEVHYEANERDLQKDFVQLHAGC